MKITKRKIGSAVECYVLVGQLHRWDKVTNLEFIAQLHKSVQIVLSARDRYTRSRKINNVS